MFLSAAASFAPEVLGYALNAYGAPSNLLFGEHRILSAAGVQQGDPAGPLLYSLAEHVVVSRAWAALPPDVAARLVKVYYLDDGTVVGPRADVRAFFDALVAASPAAGLTFNIRKCEVASLDSGADAAAFPGMLCTPLAALTLLGSPCGDLEHAAAFVAASLAKRHLSLRRLRALPAHHAFLLLRSCCSFAVGGYFARAAGPQPALAAFDTLVRDVFADVVHDPSPTQWEQAQLPLRLGGLALRSAARHAAHAHCAMNAEAALLINEHFPAASGLGVVDPLLQHAVSVVPVVLSSSQSDEVRAALDAPTSERKLQKRWSGYVDEAAWQRLFDAGSPRDHARLQSLRDPFASAWLRYVPVLAPPAPLPSDQFVAAVRFRLGSQLFPQAGQQSCVCGAPVDLLGDHALSCLRGGAHTSAHNSVVRALADLIAVRFPGRTHIEAHPFAAHYGSRLDLVVDTHDGRTLIDVALTNEHAPIAATAPGAWCTEYEQIKVRRYAADIERQLALDPTTPLRLVPAVFDFWGACGQTARTTLPSLLRPAGALNTSFPQCAAAAAMQVLSHALAKATAVLLLRFGQRGPGLCGE